MGLSSLADTIAGYGKTIGSAATDMVKGYADATVQAAADTLKNANTPKSAVQETHVAVQVGENSNGTPVVPLPAGVSTVNGQIVTTAAVPSWVWYAGGGFLLLVGGAIVWKAVK